MALFVETYENSLSIYNTGKFVVNNSKKNEEYQLT